MRNQISAMEGQLKKIIATNLKQLMFRKKISQSKLSELSGIPQSTISDIIQEKFLVNAGKIQKLSDALNVHKSEIDISFRHDFINADFKCCETPYSHLEILFQLENDLYFEGNLLNKEDKEKIIEMIRILISKK